MTTGLKDNGEDVVVVAFNPVAIVTVCPVVIGGANGALIVASSAVGPGPVVTVNAPMAARAAPPIAAATACRREFGFIGTELPAHGHLKPGKRSAAAGSPATVVAAQCGRGEAGRSRRDHSKMAVRRRREAMTGRLPVADTAKRSRSPTLSCMRRTGPR